MKRKHITQTISIILACLLCSAIVAIGEAAPATHAELMQWRDEIWAQTRNQPVVNDPLETYDPTGSATYLIQQERYTIESASPILDVEQNPILGVTLNDGQALGPRGTGLGMWAEDILAAYQNDNPALIGSQEYAALYVYDAAWGLVMRDRQGLLSIEYVAATPSDCIVLSYVIADGQVSGLRVSGFGDSASFELMGGCVDTVRGIAADTSYDPEAGMLPPLHAGMFQPEDLVFSGLDFLNEDEWTIHAKETELSLPVSRFEGDPGLDFSFADRWGAEEGWRLDTLRITHPDFQGPRGLRVGDPMVEALARFRWEDPASQGPLSILYAPGETMEQPPFGLLEMHSDGEATIRYAAPAGEGEAVTLQITVEDSRITEIYIYRWREES